MNILWLIYIIFFGISVVASGIGAALRLPQLVSPNVNYYLDVFACFNGFFLLLAMTQYKYGKPRLHHHLWRFLGIFLIIFAALFLHRAAIDTAILKILTSSNLLTSIGNFAGVLFYFFITALVLLLFSPALIAYARCSKFLKERQSPPAQKSVAEVPPSKPIAQVKSSGIRKEQIPAFIILGVVGLAFIGLMIFAWVASIPKMELEENERKIERLLVAGQPEEALPLALRNLELCETKLKYEDDENAQPYGRVQRKLAVIYHQLGKPDLAEQHMKEAFDEEVRGELGYPHAYRSEVTYDYALTLVNNQKLEEAAPYLEYVRQCVREFKARLFFNLTQFFYSYLLVQIQLDANYDATGLKKDLEAIIAQPDYDEYKMSLQNLGDLRRFYSSFDNIVAEMRRAVALKNSTVTSNQLSAIPESTVKT